MERYEVGFKLAVGVGEDTSKVLNQLRGAPVEGTKVDARLVIVIGVDVVPYRHRSFHHRRHLRSNFGGLWGFYGKFLGVYGWWFWRFYGGWFWGFYEKFLGVFIGGGFGGFMGGGFGGLWRFGGLRVWSFS